MASEPFLAKTILLMVDAFPKMAEKMVKVKVMTP